jgi:hypothetical protein
MIKLDRRNPDQDRNAQTESSIKQEEHTNAGSTTPLL